MKRVFPVSGITPDDVLIVPDDWVNTELETARVLDWLETRDNYHTPWACRFETDGWALIDNESDVIIDEYKERLW